MFPMALMNNPVLALVQAMQRGQNPINLMQQFAGNDPRMGQFMQMIQGKTPQEIRSVTQNVASELHVDLNQMLRDLGINSASFR